VDYRKEAREFLVSRRAKITPEQANLPAGTNRRVPGLRRSEVAALAKELQNLVGELSTRSDEFRKRWGGHNVRRHGTGPKTFHHQIVGDLTLAYEGLEMAAEPGLTLTIYTAEPGSPSEQTLRLLASWTSTPDQPPAVSSDSNT
jgi:hypothetical protein